ncbi:ABC transporter permease subunit [Archaeoglobus neptunius]|uniref:ABC transporter permease subunit n=1 Tax=Archaeoglobus neptunius TaxID=2798580 RepID=UPI0019264053|nr:hypothetical protein [Archaeoglobus neptunius]
MISPLLTAIFISFYSSALILNYRIGGLLNLSFASLYTLGAYMLVAVNSKSVAAVFAFLISFTIALGLAKITERLSAGEATIVSLGFAIGIEETIRIYFRSSYYQIIETNYISVFGEAVDVNWIYGSAIFLMLLAFFTFIQMSAFGLKLRFVEEDCELAEIYGVRTRRIRLSAIAITSGLIGVAGAVLAPTQAISPAMGWSVLIVSVVVAAIASLAGNAGLRKYLATFPVALLYMLVIQTMGWLA